MNRRKNPITDPDEIRKLISGHGRWWHEIELAPGIVTPGDDSNRMKVPILDGLGLAADMTGMRVLDIGCSDGFFSFEMERRGADVVAIDFVPETYTGFSTARTVLDSAVEYRMDNVYNVSPEGYGLFDVVLFLGVLYHLRKPLAALDAVRSVMKDGAQLFVGTMLIDDYFLLPDRTVSSLSAVNPVLNNMPIWQAYPGDSLNGDFTNCFAPNRRALEVALEEAQFQVEAVQIVSMGGYVRASAVSDERVSKYQRLDGRLETSAFDPEVPYFLDEPGSVHDVTGRRDNAVETQPSDQTSSDLPQPKSVTERVPWWKLWKR